MIRVLYLMLFRQLQLPFKNGEVTDCCQAASIEVFAQRGVEILNQEDKHLVKTFIDAFLTKRKIQKLAV
jgi:hypothetical protein